MVQGSRVTTRVQPVSRHSPTAFAASRTARISAWAVGSPTASRSLWPRPMTAPAGSSTIAPTGTSPLGSASSASARASRMAGAQGSRSGSGRGPVRGKACCMAPSLPHRTGQNWTGRNWTGRDPGRLTHRLQDVAHAQGVGDLGEGVAGDGALDAHVHQLLGADAELDQQSGVAQRARRYAVGVDSRVLVVVLVLRRGGVLVQIDHQVVQIAVGVTPQQLVREDDLAVGAA